MTSLDAYRAACAAKRPKALADGLARVPELDTRLFPHQAHGVEFALRAGRAALFYDTGLGKSFMMFEWGRRVVEVTNKPVLMLAPLAVSAQHLREAERFGIDAAISRFGQPPSSPKIVITNYERLERFDPADYAGVILDECFAPDTLIDVVDRAGRRDAIKIEKIRIGDRIINASGVDIVSDVHRREVPYAVRVRYAGKSVICSPNHPFFTREGWKGAMDLVAGDAIVATSSAMRMVRRNVCRQIRPNGQSAFLRTILLSEMANASTGNFGESSLARSCDEARKEEERVAPRWIGGSAKRTRSRRSLKPNVESRVAGEVIAPIERDRPQTFRAWRKRPWAHGAAESFDGCTARQLDCGISFITGAAESWLSNALQARLGERRNENLRRGRWSLSSEPKSDRRKEGRKAPFYGVESVEILELGHHDLDKYRDADGTLYFYDLGGTRHPSFSVNGGLVHNSSILKNFSGVTSRKLIDAFSGMRFRLAGSATPAPNDHTELGQQCEFLGVMKRDEMLMRWFLHDSADTKTWRLKGHGVAHFWDWVASWARCVSKPSDLGFSDDGFVLPPLHVERHIVASDRTIASGEEKDGQMRLFRIPERSATSLHKEKRITCSPRAEKVAEIVAFHPDEPICIWVDTDYEAEAVRAALPGVVQVHGKMDADQKEELLDSFSRGETRVLLTKPKLAGMGLNWQHCHTTVFCGLSHSYEQFYQAVRRFWRFGQRRPVTAHIVLSDTEAEIAAVVDRKAGDHDKMKHEMASAMMRAVRSHEILEPYHPSEPALLPAWLAGADT
jgi:hypothetical protein